MSKRYIITIEEESEEVVRQGQKWERGAGETPEDYGNTPEIRVTRSVERTVYKQNVDALDVVAVINAVNKGETT